MKSIENDTSTYVQRWKEYMSRHREQIDFLGKQHDTSEEKSHAGIFFGETYKI